ncbi:hypothetical protein E4099_17015 [Streptomyces palmae]|uniref:Uncharacterized protein n=1 Tax=Streptomyces palmae TaxID=1701085 RepID=A0A4Z0H9Z5_9ACTN|nr:hypothetical protein E4099_17015 [Streptomyces palmae]
MPGRPRRRDAPGGPDHPGATLSSVPRAAVEDRRRGRNPCRSSTVGPLSWTVARRGPPQAKSPREVAPVPPHPSFDPLKRRSKAVRRHSLITRPRSHRRVRTRCADGAGPPRCVPGAPGCGPA